MVFAMKHEENQSVLVVVTYPNTKRGYAVYETQTPLVVCGVQIPRYTKVDMRYLPPLARVLFKPTGQCFCAVAVQSVLLHGGATRKVANRFFRHALHRSEMSVCRRWLLSSIVSLHSFFSTHSNQELRGR